MTTVFKRKKNEIGGWMVIQFISLCTGSKSILETHFFSQEIMPLFQITDSTLYDRCLSIKMQ